MHGIDISFIVPRFVYQSAIAVVGLFGFTDVLVFVAAFTSIQIVFHHEFHRIWTEVFY